MIHWWQDFKAWRRGEQRVAPKGVRGRIYSKKEGAPSSPNNIRTSARSKVTLRMQVIRANGQVEEVVVPAEVRQGG